MVCIIVKTNMFGRSKSLASPEVSSKLHVSLERKGERESEGEGKKERGKGVGGLEYD